MLVILSGKKFMDNKNFSHYFIDVEHKESDYFMFEDEFLNVKAKFKSCNNVFSKNEVDYGTKVLMTAIVKNYDLNNKNCLDLGCGLGVVSVFLSKLFKEVNFVLSDITDITIKLSQQNLKINNCASFKIIKSNLFENIDEKFDYIITNPPIRVGKQLLLKLIEDSVNFLNHDGKLILVIRKNHGEESIKKYMEGIFENVEIIRRDKGFYVLVGYNGNN